MKLYRKIIDKNHIAMNDEITLCGIEIIGKNYIGQQTKPSCPICMERYEQLENELKLLEKYGI